MRQAPQRQQNCITVVYDGLCHMCGGSIAWIAHRLDGRVRFVPVQSGEGTEILKSAGLDARNPASFLVVTNGESLQKSAAIITLLNLVGGGWQTVALILRLLPQSLADKIYDWIAANRYRWFGRRETCFVPRQQRP